jgi:hypothetical protein
MNRVKANPAGNNFYDFLGSAANLRPENGLGRDGIENIFYFFCRTNGISISLQGQANEGKRDGIKV